MVEHEALAWKSFYELGCDGCCDQPLIGEPVHRKSDANPGKLPHFVAVAAAVIVLVLVLGGIYVIGSGAIRLALGDQPATDYVIGGLAVVLAVVFIILGQDRPLES